MKGNQKETLPQCSMNVIIFPYFFKKIALFTVFL